MLPRIKKTPKAVAELHKGDKIICASRDEANRVAANRVADDLARMGYEATCKGREGIRHNILTIIKEPKEGKDGNRKH